MPDEPKSNRGGKRAGAGRKPGSRQKAPKKLDHGNRLLPKLPKSLEPKAFELKRMTADEMRDMARGFAYIAIKTLADIAEDEGVKEASRVAASREIMDRAFGKPATVGAFAPLGKKEQANEDAKKAGHGTDWGDDLETPAARVN